MLHKVLGEVHYIINCRSYINQSCEAKDNVRLDFQQYSYIGSYKISVVNSTIESLNFLDKKMGQSIIDTYKIRSSLSCRVSSNLQFLAKLKQP